MFSNIANFSNTNDYLSLFNGVLISDLFVIFLSYVGIINSVVLKEWYNTYKLSGVLADVLSFLIGLIITRLLYFYIFDSFSIIKFIILAVGIQITHDILFYLFFKSLPRGTNKMLDTFKDYANEVSYKAILSDSCMIIMSSLIASYLANKTMNTNIIVMIVSLYILPYLLYM